MSGNMTSSEEKAQQEVLHELRELLAEEFPSLVEIYLADANKRISRLQLAIAEEDVSIIEVEAHSLKGSTSNVGAVKLASLFSELERNGSCGVLNELPILLTEIQSEFSRTEQFLRSYL